MKDFLGEELNIDDEVVLIEPGYRQLIKAKIIKFTKCYVILRYPSKYHKSSVIDIKQSPSQLVKIK